MMSTVVQQHKARFHRDFRAVFSPVKDQAEVSL